jgi:hypothetical protein
MTAILWHLVPMRHFRVLTLLACGLVCGGCFQMTTIVHVTGDGSGTIDHSLIITKAALAQVRQFSALAGGRGQNLDFVSEEQARRMAESLGPGVSYVSSEAIDTSAGEGRSSKYAFTDINNLRINPQPEAPGGISIKTQTFSTDSGAITCSFARDPNGNAVLRINLPELNLQSALGNANTGDAGINRQLAMVRTLLAGARILIGVVPDGALVKTSSPFVDGPRVTLLDVNLDQVLANEALIAQVQAARTPEEIRAALSGVPGLRIALEREVTIEFTPVTK